MLAHSRHHGDTQHAIGLDDDHVHRHLHSIDSKHDLHHTRFTRRKGAKTRSGGGGGRGGDIPLPAGPPPAAAFEKAGRGRGDGRSRRASLKMAPAVRTPVSKHASLLDMDTHGVHTFDESGDLGLDPPPAPAAEKHEVGRLVAARERREASEARAKAHKSADVAKMRAMLAGKGLSAAAEAGKEKKEKEEEKEKEAPPLGPAFGRATLRHVSTHDRLRKDVKKEEKPMPDWQHKAHAMAGRRGMTRSLRKLKGLASVRHLAGNK